MDNLQNEIIHNKNHYLTKSPIFYFSNIFAIFPFGLNEYLPPRYTSLLYSFALIIAFGQFYFIQIHVINRNEQLNTNVLLYAGYATMNIILSITAIITPITKRDSILSIIKSFTKVDNVIKIIDPEFNILNNQKPTNKRQYLQIIILSFSTVILFLLHVKAESENTFPSFSYLEFYILPTNWLIIFQIDYFITRVTDRFNFVNSKIRNILTTIRSRKNRTISDNHKLLNADMINRFNHVHYILYTILNDISDSYGPQLLIMVPRVIFFSVLPVHYNIVTALVKNPKEPDLPQIWTHIFTLSFIALLAAPIIYVVHISTNTVKQGKKIHLLIHDLIDEDQDYRTEYELLIFSIQLIHRKIDFSVHEFFSLKPSLTTTMFELIITYVIILLQFQDTLASISPIRLLLRPIDSMEIENSNGINSTISTISTTPMIQMDNNN